METIESGPNLDKKKESKLTVDALEEIQSNYEKKMEDDKTARNPLSHTKFEDLIPEVLILYEKLDSPEDALTSLTLAQEKVEQLKKKKNKKLSSNEEFIQWIDDQIRERVGIKELEDDRARNN